MQALSSFSTIYYISVHLQSELIWDHTCTCLTADIESYFQFLKVKCYTLPIKRYPTKNKQTNSCFAVLMPWTMACRCTSQSSCSLLTYFLRARFRFWLVCSSFTIKIHNETTKHTCQAHKRLTVLRTIPYPFLCCRDFCDFLWHFTAWNTHFTVWPPPHCSHHDGMLHYIHPQPTISLLMPKPNQVCVSCSKVSASCRYYEFADRPNWKNKTLCSAFDCFPGMLLPKPSSQ